MARSTERRRIVAALLEQGRIWGIQFRNLAFKRVGSAPLPGESKPVLDLETGPGTSIGRRFDDADYLLCSDFRTAQRRAASAVTSGGRGVVDAACEYVAARREFMCTVQVPGGQRKTVTIAKGEDKKFSVK
jgi:hypothetical protein